MEDKTLTANNSQLVKKITNHTSTHAAGFMLVLTTLELENNNNILLL